MINWFVDLDIGYKVTIIVACIGAIGGIITAIIKGLFEILKKCKGKGKEANESKIVINQTAHDNAKQTGIVINNKEGE